MISPSLAEGEQNNHVVLERLHNYLKITVDNNGYNLSIIDLDTRVDFTRYDAENVVIC